jgi:hypothetical protein
MFFFFFHIRVVSLPSLEPNVLKYRTNGLVPWDRYIFDFYAIGPSNIG